VSRTRNDPALSNGAAGLQDPEKRVRIIEREAVLCCGSVYGCLNIGS